MIASQASSTTSGENIDEIQPLHSTNATNRPLESDQPALVDAAKMEDYYDEVPPFASSTILNDTSMSGNSRTYDNIATVGAPSLASTLTKAAEQQKLGGSRSSSSLIERIRQKQMKKQQQQQQQQQQIKNVVTEGDEPSHETTYASETSSAYRDPLATLAPSPTLTNQENVSPVVPTENVDLSVIQQGLELEKDYSTAGVEAVKDSLSETGTPKDMMLPGSNTVNNVNHDEILPEQPSFNNNSSAATGTNSNTYASPFAAPSEEMQPPNYSNKSSSEAPSPSIEPMMIMSSMQSGVRSLSSSMKNMMSIALSRNEDDFIDTSSDAGAQESLLSASARYDYDEEFGDDGIEGRYSMKTYFITFCEDMYGLTLGRLPPQMRVGVVVAVLIFCIWMIFR